MSWRETILYRFRLYGGDSTFHYPHDTTDNNAVHDMGFPAQKVESLFSLINARHVFLTDN